MSTQCTHTHTHAIQNAIFHWNIQCNQMFSPFPYHDCYSFAFSLNTGGLIEHSLKRAVHQATAIRFMPNSFLFYRLLPGNFGSSGIIHMEYIGVPWNNIKNGKWIILQLTLGRHMIRLMPEHIQIVCFELRLRAANRPCSRWYWNSNLMNTVLNATLSLSPSLLPFFSFIHSENHQLDWDPIFLQFYSHLVFEVFSHSNNFTLVIESLKAVAINWFVWKLTPSWDRCRWVWILSLSRNSLHYHLYMICRIWISHKLQILLTRKRHTNKRSDIRNLCFSELENTNYLNGENQNRENQYNENKLLNSVNFLK